MKKTCFVAIVLGVLLVTQCSKKKGVLDDQLSTKKDTAAVAPGNEQADTQDSDMERAITSLFQPLYFAFDSYSLSEENRDHLAEIGRFMRNYPSVQVRIEGHCDERGSAEYNMALGQRRADEAKKYLTDYGIAPGRFTTVTWGEERPAIEGHDESAWAKNRRAEFQRN